MSEQFFTDEKMTVIGIAVFVYMLIIGVVLLVSRDMDALWVGAFECIQILPLVYYYQLWLSPDSPILLFPQVNLLIRPAIVSFWFLVCSYATVRLILKRSFKTL